MGGAPQSTQKLKTRLTRANTIISPHFLEPQLFLHKNNYLSINIITIYFDKSKLAVTAWSFIVFFNLLTLNIIYILYVFLWVKLLILNEMMFICLNDNCE